MYFLCRGVKHMIVAMATAGAVSMAKTTASVPTVDSDTTQPGTAPGQRWDKMPKWNCTVVILSLSLPSPPSPSVIKSATCVVEQIISVLNARMTFAPTATRRSIVVAHAPPPGPAHGHSVCDVSWRGTMPLWVGHVTVIWSKANICSFEFRSVLTCGGNFTIQQWVILMLCGVSNWS